MFTFDTRSHTWNRPCVSGDIPGERDGHSAAIVGRALFKIFIYFLFLFFIKGAEANLYT